MLRSVKEMMGYKLATTDGPIGKVKDFLFDDTHWTVRWMVADTGNWLPGKKVLVSPIALGEPDWNTRLFPVRMTREEVEQAPHLDADAPVSRKYEKQWFDQYGWPYYWGGAGVWGPAAAPGDLFSRKEKEEALGGSPEASGEVLRSTDEVLGYHIHAKDGDVGHVEEVVLDDTVWTIRYMVVDTRNWLPGRKVLIAPSWIDSIQWADRKVTVDVTREAVKDSPAYDPSVPVNRDYEARLYDYYGRPVYWTE